MTTQADWLKVAIISTWKEVWPFIHRLRGSGDFVFSLFFLKKGHGPLFEQIWIPLIQGCFVPSFIEIGPVILEKAIFLMSSMCFHCYLPLEESSLLLKLLESSSSNDNFCQVCLKLVQLFRRRRCLNVINASIKRKEHIWPLICSNLNSFLMFCAKFG